jgi:hypothetical protein
MKTTPLHHDDKIMEQLFHIIVLFFDLKFKEPPNHEEKEKLSTI